MNIKKNIDSMEWDDFVDHSNNGTIFHKQKFLSYHYPNRFNFEHLAFYKNNEMIALLPGGIEGSTYKSPLGASYGSFVSKELSFNEYEEMIDTLIDYARKTMIQNIYLIPPPIIYLKKQNQIEPFLLEYKGFQIKYDLISHACNLEQFKIKKEILANVKKRFRGDVNISLRNEIEIKQNSDFESFYPILLENKRKFKTTPTHTLEEIKLLAILYPENIKLFMAYKDNKPIAGILLFVVNNISVLTFYICQDYSYQNTRAVSRLLYETLCWSKRKGYTWYDLGVSMDTFSKNPMEPSRSLIFFKEGIGATGFLRSAYHYLVKR